MTLPSGWTRATVGEIAEFRNDKADPTKLGQTLFVGLEHVESYTSQLLGYGSALDVKSSVVLFDSGDILFGRLRPYLNKVIRPNFSGCASAEFVVLKPEVGIAGELVRLLLRSNKFLAYTASLDQGDRPRVSANDVAAFEVAIPPLAEQHRIVAKLDALTARLTRARTELDRIKTLALRGRKATLNAAFHAIDFERAGDGSQEQNVETRPSEVDGRTGILHNLPNRWRWISLGEISDVSGGLTKNSKRELLPVKRPYLRVANVYADELRLSEISEIGCTENEFLKTKLQKGDLLIVEGNGSLDQVGRVGMWKGEVPECSHQNHLIRVRPKAAVASRFLLYWLLSPAGRIHLERMASSSSGLHTLSISKIAGMPCPLPPLDEQISIIEYLETTFARADRLEAEAARSRKLLDHLESAILAKAFRGELVPQNPTDEPASALLNRIQSHRATNPTGKWGRRKA